MLPTPGSGGRLVSSLLKYSYWQGKTQQRAPGTELRAAQAAMSCQLAHFSGMASPGELGQM